mmetsp:Transcript_10036/g.16240  ORF Transcript_10036/g.16240 Transcript_10036/m.16240 type:complete len:405 (+) Transcript_10036:235-1449(+)
MKVFFLALSIILVSGSLVSAFTNQGSRRYVAQRPAPALFMVSLSEPSYKKYGTLPVADLHGFPEQVAVSETSPAPYKVDPFALVKNDLVPFSDNIKELVETDHPVLSMAAKHFFEKRHGKRFRPTICTLMARAVAQDANYGSTDAYAKQGKLGQITEMIHVASLIHDDVLDEADTRRGGDAVHKMYTNKVAVLAGDFLLARASVLLARLNDVNVVEIMAGALDALVRGEIMQAKSEPEDTLKMEYYLRKSYYKTASLIASCCKSCALLSGHALDSEITENAEKYGYHMGLAFQIVDDILDFTVSSDLLGKPALADVSLGLATAPVLYAAEERPELKAMIKRRFKNKGDKEKTLQIVTETEGVQRSRELARYHAQEAVNAICKLPPSESRDALIQVCHIVLTRNK